MQYGACHTWLESVHGYISPGTFQSYHLQQSCLLEVTVKNLVNSAAYHIHCFFAQLFFFNLVSTEANKVPESKLSVLEISFMSPGNNGKDLRDLAGTYHHNGETESRKSGV